MTVLEEIAMNMTNVQYTDETQKKLRQALAAAQALRNDEALEQMDKGDLSNSLRAISGLLEDAENLLQESWELERKV